MPTLDYCIANIYEPGNIGASSGQTPVAPTMPPIEPTITSSDTVSVPESQELAHSLTADKSVTWSIIGGADQAQFELDGPTLTWVADGVQDFEDPQDADTNNDYIVQVRATDFSSNTDDQVITVTVLDGAWLLDGGEWSDAGEWGDGEVWEDS